MGYIYLELLLVYRFEGGRKVIGMEDGGWIQKLSGKKQGSYMSGCSWLHLIHDLIMDGDISWHY